VGERRGAHVAAHLQGMYLGFRCIDGEARGGLRGVSLGLGESEMSTPHMQATQSHNNVTPAPAPLTCLRPMRLCECHRRARRRRGAHRLGCGQLRRELLDTLLRAFAV
jgi:hypothetical protein